jgi:hypothetical protein
MNSTNEHGSSIRLSFLSVHHTINDKMTFLQFLSVAIAVYMAHPTPATNESGRVNCSLESEIKLSAKKPLSDKGVTTQKYTVNVYTKIVQKSITSYTAIAALQIYVAY